MAAQRSGGGKDVVVDRQQQVFAQRPGGLPTTGGLIRRAQSAWVNYVTPATWGENFAQLLKTAMASAASRPAPAWRQLTVPQRLD
jgi:hypothetical protein